MRLSFSELFAIEPAQGFRPKTVVRLGTLTLSRDVLIAKDDSELGASIAAMANHDVEVQRASDGALEVTGFYDDTQDKEAFGPLGTALRRPQRSRGDSLSA